MKIHIRIIDFELKHHFKHQFLTAWTNQKRAIYKLEKKFIEHQLRKNRSEEKSKQIRRSLSIEIENKLEAEMQGINKVKVN